ncbi:sugar ABC transporter permease [Cytobacillus sp. S13-E01]|uniref:carbohydrate ABC transporter permease n=1 Tax=Cytobacillus sp. S13-E01 TaxID=3031326 RepID=UPI0023D7F439|nr:sugar ABC transporter permease [Cytobacillus sp. S13-E01]MDF0726326.1 sugar ABC transporter permease [Cytobacillus sp. S13-E01]
MAKINHKKDLAITQNVKNKQPKFEFTLKQQKYIFVYSCLLIPLLFFIVIRFAPTLYTFNVGFREWDILSPEKPFVGMDNYVNLFKDEVFLKSMLNTIIYVVVGVSGQLIIGLAIALMLQRINRFVGLFRVIYFIPYITSIVAVSWVFKWLLMPNGIVNDWLVKLGFESQLFLGSPTQAIYVIIATMIWQGLGFQMIIFLAGLENIPKMFYEAADIDGANGWHKFKSITIPLLNPTIVFSAVIGSIGFLQSFTQVLNMTQGGPLNSSNTMVHYIYQLAFQQYKMGYAAAATVILFLIVLLLTLFQMKVLTKKFEY